MVLKYKSCYLIDRLFYYTSNLASFGLLFLKQLWSKQAYITLNQFFLSEIYRSATLQLQSKSDLSPRILLHFGSLNTELFYLLFMQVYNYLLTRTTLYSTYEDFPVMTIKKFRIYQDVCVVDACYCSSFPVFGPGLDPL